MTLKSAPYYWLECDKCGERAEYDEFSAMGTAGQAIDLAIDGEWSMQGERHHCPACPRIANCERCGKDAGELPMERDDHCQACWDEMEALDVPASPPAAGVTP
jgi:hypothetical protein